MYYTRCEIERCIKEQQVDRSCFFEVSKLHYAGIIRKIEQTFVFRGGNIHWSNTRNAFNPALRCSTFNVGGNPLWFDNLYDILPASVNMLYVLFEDRKNYSAKYWLYEATIPELIIVLKETEGLGDFYIISKKFDWLISENHEEIVSFVGECFNLEMFLKQP